MDNKAPNESSVAKTNRLLNKAKQALEDIVRDAAKDPQYFGKPSVELTIQGGVLETLTVNSSLRHK